MGERLWRLLTALSAEYRFLSDWHSRADDATLTPLVSQRDCVDAVQRCARSWTMAKREYTAYDVTVVAGSGLAHAEISIICGLEPFPIWIPNQVQVELFPTSGITERDVGPLEDVLRSMAAAYDAAWGFVQVDGYPSAPVPPWASGQPVVGWLTYLSNAYPSVPVVLPQPSVARRSEKGTVIVAHPKSPDSESIQSLRTTLGEAGVLLTPHELKQPRPASVWPSP